MISEIKKYTISLLNTGNSVEAVKLMKYLFTVMSPERITTYDYELLGWAYIMDGKKDDGIRVLSYAGDPCYVKKRLVRNMKYWRKRFKNNRNLSKIKIAKISSQLICIQR